MASPEFPYLAAGSLAVFGAILRDGKLPPLGRPVIATLTLVIVAAATADTKAAPLVHAFGMFALLVTAVSVGRVVYDKQRNKKNG